jgi:hypothetical protein
MTLILELTAEQEARLRADATRIGMSVPEYAKQRLFGVGQAADKTAEVFARWAEEDKPLNREDVENREREWEEMKVRLDAERQMNCEESLFQ